MCALLDDTQITFTQAHQMWDTERIAPEIAITPTVRVTVFISSGGMQINLTYITTHNKTDFFNTDGTYKYVYHDMDSNIHT